MSSCNTLTNQSRTSKVLGCNNFTTINLFKIFTRVPQCPKCGKGCIFKAFWTEFLMSSYIRLMNQNPTFKLLGCNNFTKFNSFKFFKRVLQCPKCGKGSTFKAFWTEFLLSNFIRLMNQNPTLKFIGYKDFTTLIDQNFQMRSTVPKKSKGSIFEAF